MVSRLHMQQCMTATHKLESKGQELSAGLKWNKDTAATHTLKSQ